MSLRIGGSPEDQQCRRKRVVIGTVLSVALIVFWVGVVLWLNPGSGGSAHRGGGPSRHGAQGSRTTQTSARAGRKGHSVAKGGVQRSEKPGEIDHVTPKHPERFRLAEQKRDKLASGEPPVPPGGAADSSASYDPLGIKQKKIPLTPADRQRVEAAASKFVASAYGYSGARGTDQKYLSGVNEAVLAPEFYSSEGAGEVTKYFKEVQSSGTRSAAKVMRWVVGDASQNEVKGVVYFQTADGYDRYGELTGEKKTYRQDLTIVRYGAAFRVKAAGPIQEVKIR